MATMNVSLPDQMKTWVEKQAESGRYSNSSDYVRDLIRRDQEREAQRIELQEIVDRAMASGSKPFDRDAFFARVHEKHKSHIG